MDNIAFLLKTYRVDYKYYKRLIESFCIHNVDGIKLYVVCSPIDIHLFETSSENIIIIQESTFPIEFCVRGIGTFRPGYLNQEIVKLSFWKLGLCENYFCIDSECEFIRDFYVSDFMWDDNTPYTVFYDDSELMKDPDYYCEFGKGRKKWNRIIMDSLDVRGKKLFSCHGMGIISSIAMQRFEEQYMNPHGLAYKDLIAKAPLEFTWYSYWIQKSGVIDIHPISPLIMTYHTKYQFDIDRYAGITCDDLSRNYIGILVNSNFNNIDIEYNGINKAKKDIISFTRRKVIERMKNDTVN